MSLPGTKRNKIDVRSDVGDWGRSGHPQTVIYKLTRAMTSADAFAWAFLAVVVLAFVVLVMSPQ
jgi:hypothetical protein